MKKNGFGGMGMPGNMANLMKQAQRMQRQVEAQQKEMESKEFTGTAGGGAVKVTMDGKKVVSSVKLSPEAVDPEDIETLEELITLAVNDAAKQIDEANEAMVGQMTGGMNLGGLGGLGL